MNYFSVCSMQAVHMLCVGHRQTAGIYTLIVAGRKPVIICSQENLSNHHIILLSMVTQSHCLTDINDTKTIGSFIAIN